MHFRLHFTVRQESMLEVRWQSKDAYSIIYILLYNFTKLTQEHCTLRSQIRFQNPIEGGNGEIYMWNWELLGIRSSITGGANE